MAFIGCILHVPYHLWLSECVNLLIRFLLTGKALLAIFFTSASIAIVCAYLPLCMYFSLVNNFNGW